MAKKYAHGERIKIIGGSFVSHGYGTYIKPYGSMRAYIKVDNDTLKPHRLLWLTSVATLPEEEDDIKPTNTSTVSIDRGVYEELLKDIGALARQIQSLEERLHALNVDN
jgi:hypothetical protein